MTREQQTDLNSMYFDWMYQCVCGDRYSKRVSYRRLLGYLYDKPFRYDIPMDGNRSEDGINLRYRFGDEQGIPAAAIAQELDNRDCSVLEMMIALAIRCEEHITCDPDIGDRTGQWFWNMIVNLGLGLMTDNQFDYRETDDIVERFLDRRYERNGKGGLFTLHYCERDLRSIDIWYQMMWYLDEVLDK